MILQSTKWKMPSESREENVDLSYSVEELRKFNERHNIRVAARGKVSQTIIILAGIII